MKKFVVRYGAMRSLGVVECGDEAARGFFHGVKVVVRTARGLEAATILCETDDEKLDRLPNRPLPVAFERRADESDENELLKIKANEKDEFERCLKIIRRMKIEMTLVRVERVLGGERVVVYYVADGRVDFRELVRALAAEFQTRVEMKQIGVRDETKLLADVGDCGREVCCNTYLVAMPPVSMKMAKLQKATLDPTKVSGRCGRLKCCLRYEYDFYNELQSASPAIGEAVGTPDGRGKVVALELFAQRVVVELEDGGRRSFAVDELDRRRRPRRCEYSEYDGETGERAPNERRSKRRFQPRDGENAAKEPRRDEPKTPDAAEN
ncbi:MAG: signal peptidase [Thermoguttaceae bacterium]|nr:signal peptidase [Thermoguttaceae bacterium]